MRTEYIGGDRERYEREKMKADQGNNRETMYDALERAKEALLDFLKHGNYKGINNIDDFVVEIDNLLGLHDLGTSLFVKGYILGRIDAIERDKAEDTAKKLKKENKGRPVFSDHLREVTNHDTKFGMIAREIDLLWYVVNRMEKEIRELRTKKREPGINERLSKL